MSVEHLVIATMVDKLDEAERLRATARRVLWARIAPYARRHRFLAPAYQKSMTQDGLNYLFKEHVDTAGFQSYDWYFVNRTGDVLNGDSETVDVYVHLGRPTDYDDEMELVVAIPRSQFFAAQAAHDAFFADLTQQEAAERAAAAEKANAAAAHAREAKRLKEEETERAELAKLLEKYGKP
jgi:hypothetical protein